MKQFLAIFLIVKTTLLFSQECHQTPAIGNVSFSWGSNSITDMGGSPPTVASVLPTQISNFSGVPSVTVPIFDIQLQSNNYNISLNYTSGGVKGFPAK